jgi:hypothetical protein
MHRGLCLSLRGALVLMAATVATMMMAMTTTAAAATATRDVALSGRWDGDV